MYVPRHFTMPQDEVLDFLDNLGAADLVTATPDGYQSTFLPLLFVESSGPPDEHGVLLGHVARNNPHWHHPGPSLVVAHGSDSYISPNWYPSKTEHGRVVPTWNHLTLNLHGELVVHDDVDWVRDLVTRLTTKYEAPFAQPWQVSDAPTDYVDGQLRAIVGLEFRISRIEAKAKYSQNRPEPDQRGVVDGLRSVGDLDGAGAIEAARRWGDA